MDLFDGDKSLQASRKIFRINCVPKPRTISFRTAHSPEREESKVTVRHVVVLSVENEPRHDRSL